MRQLYAQIVVEIVSEPVRDGHVFERPPLTHVKHDLQTTPAAPERTRGLGGDLSPRSCS